MAVNVVELLKQLQRDLVDQKEYMRNLHVINRNINEKFNLVEGKISDLDNKIDRQQKTIENIEQHVKINNMVLFGNDEADLKSVEKTTASNKPDLDDKGNYYLVEPSVAFNVDANKFLNISNGAAVDEKWDYKDGNKKDERNHKTDINIDKVEEFNNSSIREIKNVNNNVVATRTASVKEAVNANCTQDPLPVHFNTDQICNTNEMKLIIDIYKTDMKEVKELLRDLVSKRKWPIVEAANEDNDHETVPVSAESSTSVSSDQTKKLGDELKYITDKYQSDMSEMKGKIQDLAEEVKIAVKETASLNIKLDGLQIASTCHNVDQISLFNDEVKLITDKFQTELKDMKELIMNIEATNKPSPEKAGNLTRKQETVKISPTYFTVSQISKLNNELRRVTEKYQSTNVFPAIEVTPGPADDHPVMKQLREGVLYTSEDNNEYFPVKLGTDGLQSSFVLDLLAEFPDFLLHDVVRAWLESTDSWSAMHKKFTFTDLWHNKSYKSHFTTV